MVGWCRLGWFVLTLPGKGVPDPRKRYDHRAPTMGCCFSRHANAAETELPKPEWGKPFKCRLQKKGMFDADYTVYSEKDEKWMLIDAVGGMWDAGYTYFLKHRAKGQVDAEGKATSTTLGAVNVKGEWDAFSFKVSGAGKDVDCGPFYDVWDGDYDWGISSSEKIWAVWTYSKRAVLYSDPEMTKQIGWLDITGYAARGSNPRHDPRLAAARRVKSRLTDEQTPD